ncbi:helix-turn-helix domain-containing protein [Sinomonas sp. ASV322]|uniref:winged helix-turn-helix transcriptional regulator n=1 Tax=Sinomonas sp. ASV322 TaxID=3041920 RepID=UPI0027DD4B3D|nr:helix-turn-helix domain-containing protein [Sinomonas sp. ASV322]MDQ4504038.1 helix-turn-helix domain-containing protein [Sinomonas sp. ASV322]
MTLTAEQKRQAAYEDYNAMLEGCPARQLLEAISSKWVTLILLELAGGSRRHSELRRQIVGASQKMLTSTLRALERDGLVLRTTTPSIPPRSDYELTGLGRSLLPLIESMKAWSESNMDAVARSRMSHDRQQATSAVVH